MAYGTDEFEVCPTAGSEFVGDVADGTAPRYGTRAIRATRP